MKRVGLIVGGVCGFVCALGFALLLLAYIRGGSGGQVIGLPPAVFGDSMVSSGSIFIGLVHVVGLAAASFLCFTVGVGFCVHGIVAEQGPHQVSGPNRR